MSVLLVDLCHTLVDANTTFDFLDQHLAENPEYQVLAKQRGSFWQRLKSKVSPGTDPIRQQAIALLKGQEKAALEVAAQQFATTVLPLSAPRAYMDRRKAEGARVYLVSSSLDFIVEAFAALIGVDGWFGSEMEFQAGICTGRLKTDLTGNKHEIIQAHFGTEDDIEFVTDNYSDANCISLVQSFRPVYRSSNVRGRAFWLGKETAEPIVYE